jgi:hypothetical protein
MRLKSFGCSFIFGTELGDEAGDTPGAGYKHYSKLTWAAHLSQHLNATYECYAKPGAGNLQILENILNQASNRDDHNLFVIGWTWIDRFDYYNDRSKFLWEDWSTIMPVDETETAKVYYRDLHSEYRDKFTCLSYIKLAIDTLKQKNIPFIMTYIDDLIFDQRWHTTPAVIDLQEYVQPYMTTFDNHTFIDWSKKNGYPITKIGHPLEAAHAAAGDYMIKVFDKQNISGQAQ